ncbi:MAG: FAD-dependent oxidoreductase [Parabacteroides sp.]|nr:FAD-dependent oxidoreductase [Parabacteroides sp.]
MTEDNKYDLIVCGGGPSGVSAAITAARKGAKTLLIERYGFCGGMATAALVNPFSGHEYTTADGTKNGSLIGGLFKEIIQNLNDKGGYGSILSPAAFDEEILKIVYDEMLLEAGVHIKYHSFIKAIKAEDKEIKSVEVYSKEGLKEYFGKMFIDGTGDGDIAAKAGLNITVGRPEDGLTQAMTVSFRMGNVDKADMISTGHIRKARALVEPYFQEALATGSLVYPYRPFVHFYDYPRDGVLHFNMTRINEVSGLSVNDLTKAEIEGRRQAHLIAGWLIKYVPYFKKSSIEKVACQVGVRETRHIKGLYLMTQDDIRSGSKFEDAIVRSRYFIDIHNPKGAHDVQQLKGTSGALNHDFGPQPGDYYEVPYRCIVSRECDNLLVPCRALSATHEASAAIRVMATMHGIGEAAGIAAVLCIKKGIKVYELEGTEVRSQIQYLNECPDFDLLWEAKCGYPWSEN